MYHPVQAIYDVYGTEANLSLQGGIVIAVYAPRGPGRKEPHTTWKIYSDTDTTVSAVFIAPEFGKCQ